MPPSAGDVFPDLVLADHAGHERQLSDLVGGDPTVLQTYRGWWCPKEQAFMRRLVAFQDEVEVAYTNIVSVSVDSPEVEAAFRAGVGARGRMGCPPDPAEPQSSYRYFFTHHSGFVNCFRCCRLMTSPSFSRMPWYTGSWRPSMSRLPL